MSELEKKEKIVNPKLGIGSKIILVVEILIFYGGIQSGIIGGVIGGAIAYGFYYIAIRLLAKYKKVELMVDKPKLTNEEIERSEKASKANKRFWIIFLSCCGVVLLLTFLLVWFLQ